MKNMNKFSLLKVNKRSGIILSSLIIPIVLISRIQAAEDSCSNLIFGCRVCDTNNQIICTSCFDGYYLLSNTTLKGDILTFCVPDCSLASPRYVNNPYTMTCTDCGDGCTSCNINFGCEMCPGLKSKNSFLYTNDTHPLSLNSQFMICQKCHTVNGYEHCLTCTGASLNSISCINCAYGISDYDCSNNLCVSESCSYNCQNSGCICSESKILSGSNSCAACTLPNCLSCTTNACQSCMRGYYSMLNPESIISSCNFCTSYSQFQYDCSTCVNLNSDIFTPNLLCNMCHSSLVLDDKSCEMSCPRGSYIDIATSQNKGIYESNVCKSCDQRCYECAENTSDNCLSCRNSMYLLLTNAGGKIGICENKTQAAFTLDIFVKASYIETSGDGTYSNPLGSIVKALSYADDQSADK